MRPAIQRRWFMRPESAAGVMLGIGLGGFLDGIVLHQVAQWHSMSSAVVPPVTMEAMSRNMVWDGLFHLATWTITVVGVFFLWDVGRRGTLAPTSALLPFVGQLLIGWGAFNLVEGLVDHHVLGLHHIRDLPVHVPLYDWIFLSAGGVGLLLVGGGSPGRGHGRSCEPSATESNLRKVNAPR
jgi:uncharacterized membrane protein